MGKRDDTDAKISTEALEKRTKEYTIDLSVDELKKFFDMLKIKKKDGKLSKLKTHLKEDVLKTKSAALPKNLITIITLKTKDVISERAAAGTMATEEDRILIREYLAAWKEYYLNYTSLLQGCLWDNGENKWDTFEQENQGFAQLLLQTQKKDLEKAEKLSEELKNCSNLLSKFSEDKLINLKESWGKSAGITLETWDENQILVVHQNVMVLSSVLPDIEKRLQAIRNLYAVHFVAKEVFYIDCNLEYSKWSGMNVLVFSNKIECISKKEVLIWNLSGSNGANSPSNPAPDGTINDPDGKDGLDGEPGKNGGQFILISQTFNNLAYVIFRSKGGDGGIGQDGGNGHDGEQGQDGFEFSLETIKAEFPSPAKQFKIDSVLNRKAVLTNLQKWGGGPHEAKSKGMDVLTGESKALSLTLSYKVSGVFENGVVFDVGYYQTSTSRQSYCLMRGVRGGAGTPAGVGGRGGLGGYGGKSGSFQAFNLDESMYGMQAGFKIELCDGEQGDDGEDGDGGNPGQNGKDGNDVGYVDNQWWRAGTWYSGEKFELSETDKEVSGSVWCNHTGKWISITPAKFANLSQQQLPNYSGSSSFGAPVNKSQRKTMNRRKNVPAPNIPTYLMQRGPDMISYAFEKYLRSVEIYDVDDVVNQNHAEWWLKNMFEVLKLDNEDK